MHLEQVLLYLVFIHLVKVTDSRKVRSFARSLEKVSVIFIVFSIISD